MSIIPIDLTGGGHSLGEFLKQFPAVTREMAVRALEEAELERLALEGLQSGRALSKVSVSPLWVATGLADEDECVAARDGGDLARG